MTVRLFHPELVALRLAVVAIQPHVDGQVHVAVARGPSRLSLTDHRLYGPFSTAEGTARLIDVVAALRQDGYVDGGLASLIATIATSKSPKARAHAAERLGWRRDTAAVDALRLRAAQPKDDITSVVTALGRIGASSSIDVVVAEAQRKLLSRRRAGGEAVRLLGDAAALAGVVAAARERLPDGVRTAALGTDPAAIATAVLALPKTDQGACLDALYDVGSEACVVAVQRLLLTLDITKPGTWRFAKSVLKRAMVRLDGATAGQLLHTIEQKGRTAKGGTITSLKSGLDGETRPTRVFSQRTAEWLAKAAWRWLTRIARYRPEQYAACAAACLAPYVDANDVVPKHRLGAQGRNFLLMRIVCGSSTRFEVDHHRAIVRTKKAKQPPSTSAVREEAFAHLWDTPAALPAIRTLLVKAQHRSVLAFAVRLATLHPEAIDGASVAELAAMVRLSGTVVAERALSVLQSRLRGSFNLALLCELAAVDDELVQRLAVTALTDHAHVWSRNIDDVLAVLVAPTALREAGTRLLLLAIPAWPEALRRTLAQRIVAAVDVDTNDDDGRFDAYVELVDVLAASFVATCTIDDALRLISRNTTAAAIAAVVVAATPGSSGQLGTELLLVLAAQPAASRRAVVCSALRVDALVLREQLGLLLELAEGEWDDVRGAAVEVLDQFEPDQLDIERVTAIIDSTWPVVQGVGMRQVANLIAAGRDLPDLLPRLAQHPHRHLRRFVLDLTSSHLRSGLLGLMRLEPMLRAIVFDLRPDVAVRRDAFGLMLRRGLQDEAQAEFIITLCRDVVSSRTHALRDAALQVISALVTAWPALASVAAEANIVVDTGVAA
jgi:hypothetical protein